MKIKTAQVCLKYKMFILVEFSLNLLIRPSS